ncbi:MAG: hypothetical protein JSW66_06225 [Phycisphaerales bacterium]|nr:MAG: hypothetical protein JSW66_06225 [Phycisphaerales bacterium]
MNRRDFMVQSIGASLLAYLSGAGAAATESSGQKQASNRLSALNPLSEYVKSYVPPRDIIDPSRPQSLTFDVIGWKTNKGRQIVSTPVLGNVTVKRSPLGAAVEYEVAQHLGNDETMTGCFRCLTDDVHSLVEWQFEYALDSERKNIASMSRTRQSGRRKGEEIVMVTDESETVSPSSAPLLCRYGLFDVASRMARLCEGHNRFTMLHEPAGLRPEQRFREDRSGVVGRGENAPVRTFLQTGPATVPTHWVVDSQGRPLFVSAFLTSWALRAIS